MAEELISLRELARRLGVCKTSIWRLANEGRLPLKRIKLGGAVRYRASEVERWIAAGCPVNWRGDDKGAGR